MTTYGRIVNGIMLERIDPFLDPQGREVPIGERFHPDFVALLTEIDPQNPPPTEAPPSAHDWRPAALQRLMSKRDRLMEVLSGMQSDYITVNDIDGATLCMNAKAGLKDIHAWPAIKAVYDDAGATLKQYEDAVVARWTEIADPAPAVVKAEFYRYAIEP